MKLLSHTFDNILVVNMTKKTLLGCLIFISLINLSWGFSILTNVNLTIDSRRVTADMTGLIDETGVPLLGSGTTTGDYVQIVDIGGDGIINVPNMADLSLTGDDAVLATINIGSGYFSASHNAGLFSRPALGVPVGKTVYVRAWNNSETANPTYYGNSSTYLVGSADPQTFFCGIFATSVNRDLSAPNTVTTFSAVAAVQAANLSWTKSSSTDNLGTLVVRSTSPITWTPSNYRTYSNYNYAGDYADFTSRVITTNVYRLYTGSAQFFQDTGLTANQTYYYSAFAYDTAYNYAPAVTSSATASGGLLDPFIKFETLAGDSSVNLSWDITSTSNSTYDHFEIWCVSSNSSATSNYPASPNAGPQKNFWGVTVSATLVASVDISARSYSDSGLINHKYYYYAIWAMKSGVDSSQSRTAYAKPVPASAYNAYNYKNPFSPASGEITNLVFPLGSAGSYSLYLFNILGQKVWSYSDVGVAGANKITWDGRNAWSHIVPNGVYLLRVVQNGKVVANGKVSVLD